MKKIEEFQQGIETMAQFEGLMDSYGKKLDRKDKKIEGSSLLEVANGLEKDEITPEWFGDINEAMMGMVEWQKKHPDNAEAVFGATFTTGFDGGIGVCVLLPMDAQTRSRGIRMADVVHGTPIMVQFRSPELVAKWGEMNYQEKVEAVKQEMDKKQQKIRTGEAKMNMNWGGWGSVPWYLLHRQQLIQRAKTKDDKQYELSVSMGLMGSAFTLNRDYLKQKKRGWDKLKLTDFKMQLESAFAGVAKMLDSDTAPNKVMSEIAPDAIGHSMGAYIAIDTAIHFGQYRQVTEAIKHAGGKVIADKPVMLGPKVSENIPDWMLEVIDDNNRQNQVKLQTGPLGVLVKLGAKDFWDKPKLSHLREKLGAEMKPFADLFKKVFEQFLTPDKMWDGKSVFNAHFWNYFWDRAYHGLCVNLLDYAPPIMSEDTMVGSRHVQEENDKFSYVYVLTADEEGILGHDVTEAMIKGLSLKEENCHRLARGKKSAHHPSVEEIAWSLGLDEDRVGE